jgi:tape measure domain-containing protein
VSTIANLTVALNADVAGFSGSLASANRALTQFSREGKQIFQATRTPLEQYDASLKRLSAHYRAGHLDVETYQRATKKLQDELRATTQAGSGAGKALASVSSGVLGFSSGVGAAVVAANLVTEAVSKVASTAINAGATGIKLAADFESAEASFKTFYGSAQAAAGVMSDLKTFAAQTPFEFPELKDSAVKLAGFGVAADQLVPTMRMLGDLTGADAAKLADLAETYGKARIQGRAYTRDINEFTTRGVPLWQALADVQHKSIEEIHALVEAGKIGFPQIQDGLIKLVSEGERFHKNLESQSKTLNGLASTLRDNVNLALAEFGAHLLRDLDAAGKLTSLIALTDNLQNDVAPALAHSVALVIEFGTELAKLDPTLKVIAESVSLGTDSFAKFSIGVQQMRLTLAKWRGDAKAATEIAAEMAGQLMRLANPPKPGASASLPEREAGTSGVGAAADETARQDAVYKHIEALQKEIDTFGMSSEAIRLYDMEMEGATDRELAAARGMMKTIDLLKEQAKAQEEARRAEEARKKTIVDTIAAMEHELDVFGMSAREAKIADAERAGATKDQLNALRYLNRELEAQEKRKKDLDRLDQLQKEVATPGEKLEERIKELNDLRASATSASQRETLDRAETKAREDFERETKGKTKEGGAGRGNAALLAGTQEFFHAALGSNPMLSVAQKQLATQQRIAKALETRPQRIARLENERRQIADQRTAGRQERSSPARQAEIAAREARQRERLANPPAVAPAPEVELALPATPNPTGGPATGRKSKAQLAQEAATNKAMARGKTAAPAGSAAENQILQIAKRRELLERDVRDSLKNRVVVKA